MFSSLHNLRPVTHSQPLAPILMPETNKKHMQRINSHIQAFLFQIGNTVATKNSTSRWPESFHDLGQNLHIT